MDPFRLNPPAVSEQLFDVVENYTQALNVFRIKRGEPIEGVARQAWEAKQWVKQNRRRVAGSATILFVAVGLFLYSRTWKQKKNIEMEHGLKAA